MRSGEVRDLHWNGGNNGDWVENDDGDILPVDDFADQYDQTYFTESGEVDNGVDAGDDNRGEFCDQPRPQKEHAVAGMAIAATDTATAANTHQSPSAKPRKSRENSRPEGPVRRKLDMSSRDYGDLTDVMPPQHDLNIPVMRSAYIAYLSSLLGEARQALDELYQSDEYQRDVAEYDRQVDEANDNYPFQPKMTKSLLAEAQAQRRIRALKQRIDEIKQLGNNPSDQQ